MAVPVVVDIPRSALGGAAQLDFVLLWRGFRGLVVRWLGWGLMGGLRLIRDVHRIGTANTADRHRLGASD